MAQTKGTSGSTKTKSASKPTSRTKNVTNNSKGVSKTTPVKKNANTSSKSTGVQSAAEKKAAAQTTRRNQQKAYDQKKAATEAAASRRNEQAWREENGPQGHGYNYDKEQAMHDQQYRAKTGNDNWGKLGTKDYEERQKSYGKRPKY